VTEPKARDVLLDPIFKRNPIALLVLGVCSALAVTNKMETARKVHMPRKKLRARFSRNTDWMKRFR
jgi:Na+-transporting NADH:ubiquinone oxidoreductase subunit NqrD